MSPRSGLLGTVWLRNAEDVAKGGYDGLQVKLRALGQERVLSKVVELEERRAAFHLDLTQRGRRHLKASSAEEMFAKSLRDDWSHF